MIVAPIILAIAIRAPLKVSIVDIKKGSGAVAHSGDVVTVDYTGKLASGKQFDTSVGRAPFTFMIGAHQVIKGWDQGVVGMRVGGIRKLTIPPSLAYGSKPVGSIPANSTLVFTVSLLKIQPPVKTTILVAGSGPGARPGQLLQIQLVGTIQGGAEIFNTYKQAGKPILIELGESDLPVGMIPGMLGMKVGEKREFVLPPALAYGAKGVPPRDMNGRKAGSIIPPNSTMIFRVELLKFVPVPVHQAPSKG